jgi:hypothetical protein
MSALLGLLLGAGGHFGRKAVNRRAALSPETVKGTVKESLSDLTQAFKDHVNANKFDVDPDVNVNLHRPKDIDLDVYLRNSNNTDGKSFTSPNVKYEKRGEPNYVDLPDNASATELAEDLGEIAFMGSNLGKQVAKADKYKDAVTIAASLLPAGYALLSPGHEDFGASMAIATALNSPQLARSIGSKYHALKMMDKRGMPVTGPSLRMAGSTLLDFSTPLIQASAGNMVANMFDAPINDYSLP